MATPDRSHWKRDNESLNCDSCKGDFGLFNRRHHCRSCGGIFCNKCSSRRMPVPVRSIKEAVRVCDPCAKILHKTSKKMMCSSGPNTLTAAEIIAGEGASGIQNNSNNNSSNKLSDADRAIGLWKSCVSCASSKFISVGDSGVVFEGGVPSYHPIATEALAEAVPTKPMPLLARYPEAAVSLSTNSGPSSASVLKSICHLKEQDHDDAAGIDSEGDLDVCRLLDQVTNVSLNFT
eukprot:PhM_4_TR4523/c1_g1_i1/m.72311